MGPQLSNSRTTHSHHCPHPQRLLDPFPWSEPWLTTHILGALAWPFAKEFAQFSLFLLNDGMRDGCRAYASMSNSCPHLQPTPPLPPGPRNDLHTHTPKDVKAPGRGSWSQKGHLPLPHQHSLDGAGRNSSPPWRVSAEIQAALSGAPRSQELGRKLPSPQTQPWLPIREL